MNEIERALMHALFKHAHHNIEDVIDFEALARMNERVTGDKLGGLAVGPSDDDDAGVFRKEDDEFLIGKMESHCSPSVVRPYDAAATGVSGAVRDVVAMGGRPIFVMDFIGTRPIQEKVLVGPCAFESDTCTCGECVEMTSKERVDIIVEGLRDMCEEIGLPIASGGFSTSFSDIVPAVVVSVVGRLVTERPLTKPAKNVGDKIIIVGKTDRSGNDTVYRAGLVDQMRPADALFEEERETMKATIEAFETSKVNACSDLGAGGIGAAVCESARSGNFGAKVDLSKVPIREEEITPEEILVCETQARMLIQVSPEDVAEVMERLESAGASAAVIGEITDDDKEVFTWGDETVAVIPNEPIEEQLKELE